MECILVKRLYCWDFNIMDIPKPKLTKNSRGASQRRLASVNKMKGIAKV